MSLQYLFDAVEQLDMELGLTPQAPLITEEPANQENKLSTTPVSKTRVVVDRLGKTRRPVNLTMEDDLIFHLKILAAKKQTQVWKVLADAVRQYLIAEGEIKECDNE